MSGNPTSYTEWRWMNGPKDGATPGSSTEEKPPWEQNMDGIYKRLREMHDDRELFVRLPPDDLKAVEAEERRLLKQGSNATAYELVSMRMNTVELKNAYHHIDARLGHAIAERDLLEATLTVEKAERESRTRQALSAEKQVTDTLERLCKLEKELKQANDLLDVRAKEIGAANQRIEDMLRERAAAEAKKRK